jgi:hypothetical protein
VAAQDDGGAFVRQTPSDGAHLTRAGRVESARWLIEKKQARRAQQRGGESETLPHPCRVASYSDVRLRRKAYLLKEATDGVRRGDLVIAIETGQQRQVPPSGQVRIKGGRLHAPGNSVR